MLYYDDFTEGETRRFGPYVVGAEEVKSFARLYDPQPFHLDAAAAERGPFGQLAASGWHTCGIVMKLMVDGFIAQTAWLGSPGTREIRWLKPVLAGSAIMASSRTVERRVSRTKPDRGLITFEWRAESENEDPLMSLLVVGIVRTRGRDQNETGR